MYFAFSRKKVITIKANCSAEKITDAIMGNIENRQHFYSPDETKPLNGEYINGEFFIGLNSLEKKNAFDRFSCKILGDETQCNVRLTFINEFYGIKGIGISLLMLFIGMFYENFLFGLLGLIFVYLIDFISFVYKINKSVEEMEFICWKAETS
ncbi:hypothetical protein [Treponema sp.]|uniref:hypothetical protein n=1 Tax=Treponema sp. TaxID=166 RepID=UPI00388F2BA2